jgi:hypothetical protein
MELDDLIKLNSHIKDPNKIQIGQKISVLGGQKTTPPAEPIDVNNSAMEYVKGMEGFIPSPTIVEKYKIKAHRTVGFGHYLDSSNGSKQSFSAAFPDKTYENFASGLGTLTEDEGALLFEQDFGRYIDRAKRLTPELESYSPELQVQILSATYRGSWGDSPRTRKLLKEGKFDEAAEEFINSDEYRNAEDNNLPGLIPRMNSVRDALKAEGGKHKTKTFEIRTHENEAKSVARFVEDKESGLSDSLSKVLKDVLSGLAPDPAKLQKTQEQFASLREFYPDWAKNLMGGAAALGGLTVAYDLAFGEGKALFIPGDGTVPPKNPTSPKPQSPETPRKFDPADRFSIDGPDRPKQKYNTIGDTAKKAEADADTNRKIAKMKRDQMIEDARRERQGTKKSMRQRQSGLSLPDELKTPQQKRISELKLGKYATSADTYVTGNHLEELRQFDKQTGGTLFDDNPEFKTKENWVNQQKHIKEASPEWKKLIGEIDSYEPKKWSGVSKILGKQLAKALPLIGFLVSTEEAIKSTEGERYGKAGGFSLDDLNQLKEPLTLFPHILQQIEDMSVAAKPLVAAALWDKTIAAAAPFTGAGDFKKITLESLLHAMTQDVSESLEMAKTLPQAVLETTLDSVFDLVKRLPQVKPELSNPPSSFLMR